jgi:outer membrane protein OmpA-like peptidoglycan-associated protein
MKKPNKLIVLLSAGSLALSSCQTANPYTGEAQRSKTATGAVLGGLVGAGIGSLTGSGSTDRRQKAMIGAGIGALAGGGIGNYMDRQEAELRRELEGTGVGVSRSGNQINLIMPGDVTFSTGSASISGQFYPTLDSVAKVLNKYNQTLVDITGHTDSVGQRDYNFRLSQQRANSVAGFLQGRKVNSARFRVSGQGPDAPVASNDTAEGRQANRRVTIQLAPLT